MKYLLLLSVLALCGCDKIADAPESSGTNHIMQMVDKQNDVLGDPNYWILRDSRNGQEYLVVSRSGDSVAVTTMRAP